MFFSTTIDKIGSLLRTNRKLSPNFKNAKSVVNIANNTGTITIGEASDSRGSSGLSSANVATSAELQQQTISNRAVYVGDLFHDMARSLIENRTFINCDIIGPGVLVFMGTGRLERCVLDSTIETSLYVIDTERLRKPVVGVAGFNNCSFLGCRLVNVGIICAPDDEEKYKAGFEQI